jgi:hypothetical protein
MKLMLNLELKLIFKCVGVKGDRGRIGNAGEKVMIKFKSNLNLMISS